ncbi:unnamed protein product [Alternaria alternata]
MQTLDHLDASATGDPTSTSILTRLISQLPCGLTRILPTKPRRETPPDPLKERLARLPPEKAVLNVRPYAQTSGPRHVPILASANGIPFLRLTKPQPPALSQVLHQRLERKTELFDTKVLLDNWWLPICRQEDKWDVLMNEQLKKREDTVRWTDAVRLSQSENQEAYEKDLKKDRQITRKMQRIVDMETELALKEGQTIVRGRRRHPIRVIKPES